MSFRVACLEIQARGSIQIWSALRVGCDIWVRVVSRSSFTFLNGPLFSFFFQISFMLCKKHMTSLFAFFFFFKLADSGRHNLTFRNYMPASERKKERKGKKQNGGDVSTKVQPATAYHWASSSGKISICKKGRATRRRSRLAVTGYVKI